MTKKASSLIILSIITSGCVVMPVSEKHQTSICSISSDKKTLKIVDVSKNDAIYFYEINGFILTPITVPVSALISGSYVLINNIYNLGEEKIMCGEN